MPEVAVLNYDRPSIWDVMNPGGKPYRPLRWQAEHFHSQKAQRIVAACGRRSGKSSAMRGEVASEAIKPAVEVLGEMKSSLIYIVGPTTETAMKVWQPVWDMFVPPDSGTYNPPLGFLHETHDKNRGYIKLINGTEIFRKTADDPRSLQGDRVTLAVVDEAHELEDEAWENLLPSLADAPGRLIAIGIPKGKKRFRSYWELGQRDEATGAVRDPEYYSFSVPTAANPIFPMAARKAGYGDDVLAYLRDKFAGDLTDDEFQRQYLAKWIEQDGQVFHNLDAVFSGVGGLPRSSQNNVMGLDIGKLHDFTVAYIGDMKTGKFIAGDRFNGLDYTLAVPRIARMYRTYGCQYIIMDATGVGEAVYDMLRREGCVVIPFKFTNESKAGIVSTLVRECERGTVSFMKTDTVLRREMELFEAKVSGTTVFYSAPHGYYDDCVMAAALLNSQLAKRHIYAKGGNKPAYVKFGSSTTKSYMPPLPPVKAT